MMSAIPTEVRGESPRSNFLSRMLSGIYSAYSNLNGATLTGAIDVIVVEHQDGSLHCSPFHVRFGKASVLSSKEKEVEISVNGEPVDDVQMRLGDSGEAFFLEDVPEVEFAALQAQQVDQLDEASKKVTEVNPPNKRVVGRKKSVYCKTVQETRDEIATHLICHEEDAESQKKVKNDVPPATQRRKKFTKTRGNSHQQSFDGSSTDEEMFNLEIDIHDTNPEAVGQNRSHRQRRSGLQSLKSMEKQLSFQIAGDVLPRLSLQICSEAEMSDQELSEVGLRTSGAKSDTEMDQGAFADADCTWGRLPLIEGEVPVVGNELQILPRRVIRRSVGSRRGLPLPARIKDKENFKTSPEPEPLPTKTRTATKEISGDVFLDDLLPAAENDPVTTEKYLGRPRSEPSDPTIIDNPSLVVRIGGNLFTWKAAAPLVASPLIFQRTLPPAVISAVKERHMKSGSSPTSSTASSPGNSSGWWLWKSSASHQSDSGLSADEVPISKLKSEAPPENVAKTSPEPNKEYREWLGSHGDVLTRVCGRPFRKTLRLNSDKLKQLGLVPGRNDVEFSVTTSLQGTNRCNCHIFLWRETDRVVISDIDGTITISDILGHVMPMLGKGWEHLGVAGLFNKIADNGYKFIYLSARAIGQATMTRGYLKSIRQDSLALPEGPVLLNPTSLLNAFHREVIIKRPQDFKISCLKDIQSLFSARRKPFYAGFGNRLTDVLSYRAVSIDMSLIFTINSKGELSRELVTPNPIAVNLDNETCITVEASANDEPTSTQSDSSYQALLNVADRIFPPVMSVKNNANETNSSRGS